MKALPYVLFMVVPVLGRMSDPNDDVRAIATNTFASLVKMVPLEVSYNVFPKVLVSNQCCRRGCQILRASQRNCSKSVFLSASFLCNFWTAVRSITTKSRSISRSTSESINKMASIGLRSLPSFSYTVFSVMVCVSWGIIS